MTPRNIVILCDGTGNEISENISNVLKLYRCLRKTERTEPRQLVFYDPGVGTLSRPAPWRELWQDFKAIWGLATGYGLDEMCWPPMPSWCTTGARATGSICSAFRAAPTRCACWRG